jgi:hypothetical protein
MMRLARCQRGRSGRRLFNRTAVTGRKAKDAKAGGFIDASFYNELEKGVFFKTLAR